MTRKLCLLGLTCFILAGCDDEVVQTDRDCTNFDDTRREMLQAVNAARNESRRCGSESVPAAPSVAWNTQLYYAAWGHAEDMVAHDFYSHIGSNGLTAEMRIAEAGYSAATWAEILGTDQNDADDMVGEWMDDSERCLHLMNPTFTEIGGGCAEDETEDTDYENYWTLLLAAPENP